MTFSKPMADGSWSPVQLSKDTFPATSGKLHYLKDGKTWVMPVKMKPGKTYAIALNNDRYRNFKDADGRSAITYLLVFETKK